MTREHVAREREKKKEKKKKVSHYLAATFFCY